jgi:hypothetical protein
MTPFTTVGVSEPWPKFSVFFNKINEIDIFSIADEAFELFSFYARGQQESCARRRNRFRKGRL